MSFEFREYEQGMIVTEPGAYLNFPMELYHAQPCEGPSLSSSGMRTIINGSLAHFYNGSSLNPDYEPFTDTEFTILGRAAHHLLLGEEDFGKHFILRPDDVGGEKWQGNKTICKNWLAEQALAGLTVVTPAQMEQIRGMAMALAAEPIVQGGILNGHVEVSLFWKDAETGIWLKSRPDVIPVSSTEAADMKCVSDVSTDGIERSLASQGYHQQGALIGEAFREVLGIEMEHFNLVYVESKRPHCVRIDEPHPEEVSAGYEENHAAIRLFKRAVETGHWPGPKNISGDGGYIRRPKWSREQSERRLKLIAQELAA